MGPIKVAIAGLGNCASSLVQGIYYYKGVTGKEERVSGLMHPSFGGYLPKDIEFVAVFEVNAGKIGKDISEAIFVHPNVVIKFAEVPKLGVEVLPAPILDGVADHMKGSFDVYDSKEMKPVDVAEELRKAGAEILINFLPVGSAEASRYYAQAALDAGCGFINCIPEFIVSDSGWQEKFRQAGLPMAGDDIKSQVGATILHRVIAQLLSDRGVEIDETYQLNIGGNTDFENMLAEHRLKSKRISKTEAVTSILDYPVPTRIGPSDYVPFLDDTKVCYIHAQGKKWGGMPISIALKLSVEDSPNSAGVVADVIRATKLALDRGISGPLLSISSYSFKHPPEQVEDNIAKRQVEEFIQGTRER
ncbi:MAG: inositol-3-phosphate synthase [Candidatus Odinarchaeota archaeon]